jgi:hypothetical protein
VCGSANGTNVTSAPTSNLCTAGNATPVSGTGPFKWSCLGSNGGTTASCSANLVSASPPSSGPASAFLARALTVFPGLDAVHQQMYKDLINGLVADGDWNNISVLLFTATQDAALSKLNLVGDKYPLAIGPPSAYWTFMPDRGWDNGDKADDWMFIQGFDPANDPNYTQNGAHVSIWINNVLLNSYPIIGSNSASQTTLIAPRSSDNQWPNTYMKINDATPLTATDAISTLPDGKGFYLMTRVDANNRYGYWNDTPLGNANSSPSGPISPGAPFVVSNYIPYDQVHVGSTRQFAAITVGGPVTAAAAHRIWLRLSAAMKAIGNPF